MIISGMAQVEGKVLTGYDVELLINGKERLTLYFSNLKDETKKNKLVVETFKIEPADLDIKVSGL